MYLFIFIFQVIAHSFIFGNLVEFKKKRVNWKPISFRETYKMCLEVLLAFIF